MNKKEYMQYQLLISNSARFNQHFPFQKIMLRKIIDFLFNDILSSEQRLKWIRVQYLNMIHILINNIDYKWIHGMVQSTLNIPSRCLFYFLLSV